MTEKYIKGAQQQTGSRKKESVNSKAGQRTSPNQSSKNKTKMKKSGDSLRDLRDILWANILIVGLPGERKGIRRNNG